MRSVRRHLAPHLAAAALAVACAAPLAGPGAVGGATAGLTELRVDLGGAGWSAAERHEASQLTARLHARFVPQRNWELQTELASQLAQAPGCHLSVGEGLSSSVLLRFRPQASWWFLQVGASTPLSGGSVDGPQRRLVRALAEPLLGFDDPDPLRGWRLHGGAVLGLALQRGVSLVGALGGEWAAGFEPVPGVRVDPADRAIGRIGLQISGADLVAEGGLAVTLEGRETAAGVLIRERRRIGQLTAGVSLSALGLRMRVGAAYAGTNEVDYIDPELRGDFVDVGPGVSGGLSTIVALRDALGYWKDAALRGALRIEYERFMPHGLPVADGWTLCLGPEFSLGRGRGALTLHFGLGTGRWRRPAAEAPPADEALRGWRVRLSRTWDLAAPSPADRAAQGDP